MEDKITTLEKKLDEHILKTTTGDAEVRKLILDNQSVLDKLALVVMGGAGVVNGKSFEIDGLADKLDSTIIRLDRLQTSLEEEKEYRKKLIRKATLVGAIVAGAIVSANKLWGLILKIIL